MAPSRWGYEHANYVRTACEAGSASNTALETVLLCNLMRIIIIAFQFSRNRPAFASDIDKASAVAISDAVMTLFDAICK
jgi:hypothetical protein